MSSFVRSFADFRFEKPKAQQHQQTIISDYIHLSNTLRVSGVHQHGDCGAKRRHPQV